MTEDDARKMLAKHLRAHARPGAADECESGKGFQESVKAILEAFETGRKDCEIEMEAAGFHQ